MSSDHFASRAARILVVDEEQHVARFLQFVLTEAGYEVALADTGEHALKAVETFLPDAILMDPVLPHMSGLEILKQIRSDPKHTKVIIWVLGRRTVPHTAEEATRAGATAFAVKPIPPSTLLNELKRMGLPPILG
jgi:CheY-like chemotaxis protein